MSEKIWSDEAWEDYGEHDGWEPNYFFGADDQAKNPGDDLRQVLALISDGGSMRLKTI